ncbi:MAG: SOS response-associated peptidase family protein [Caenibius sp.]
MTKSAAEVARLFDVPLAEGNVGGEVYPGQPGWVVGQNHMATMHWGYPLSLHGKSGQQLKPKAVNNTRSDKLTSPFWRDSFEHRRCLVPMTAFAEAEGEKGHKTRTWLSVPDEPLFACAGIWRESDEWGRVYSVIVTEPSEQVRPVHDRMPVILHRDQHEGWLRGPPAQAETMCRPFEGHLDIERTDQLWAPRH